MITWLAIGLAVCGWYAWYRTEQEADAMAAELERRDLLEEQRQYERAECSFGGPMNKRNGSITRIK